MLPFQGNAALKLVYGSEYKIGNCKGTVNYTASGSSSDWAFGEAKIPYSFAMELRGPRNSVYEFELPEDQIIPTGEEIWAFHKEAAMVIYEKFIVSRP